jgi:hypothetical protein
MSEKRAPHRLETRTEAKAFPVKTSLQDHACGTKLLKELKVKPFTPRALDLFESELPILKNKNSVPTEKVKVRASVRLRMRAQGFVREAKKALTGIFEWAWSSGLWRPTPLILGGLADSCEFGLTKARPQDAARRLNLKESKGITYPNLNAMPTQSRQFVRSTGGLRPGREQRQGTP